MLGLGDDEVSPLPAHGPGLPQDHLEVVVRSLDAPFRLRDDLLRDDEHVTLREPAGALDRIAQERAQVVAGAHLGDALQWEDSQLPHR